MLVRLLQARHLRHHHGQQRVGSDVERISTTEAFFCKIVIITFSLDNLRSKTTLWIERS